MKSVCNKRRLLMVLDVLRMQTSERNPITLGQLHDKVAAEVKPEFIVDLKSLFDDIRVLREHGYEIRDIKGNHNAKLYFYNNISLDNPKPFIS